MDCNSVIDVPRYKLLELMPVDINLIQHIDITDEVFETKDEQLQCSAIYDSILNKSDINNFTNILHTYFMVKTKQPIIFTKDAAQLNRTIKIGITLKGQVLIEAQLPINNAKAFKNGLVFIFLIEKLPMLLQKVYRKQNSIEEDTENKTKQRINQMIKATSKTINENGFEIPELKPVSVKINTQLHKVLSLMNIPVVSKIIECKATEEKFIYDKKLTVMSSELYSGSAASLKLLIENAINYSIKVDTKILGDNRFSVAIYVQGAVAFNLVVGTTAGYYVESLALILFMYAKLIELFKDFAAFLLNNDSQAKNLPADNPTAIRNAENTVRTEENLNTEGLQYIAAFFTDAGYIENMIESGIDFCKLSAYFSAKELDMKLVVEYSDFPCVNIQCQYVFEIQNTASLNYRYDGYDIDEAINAVLKTFLSELVDTINAKKNIQPFVSIGDDKSHLQLLMEDRCSCRLVEYKKLLDVNVSSMTNYLSYLPEEMYYLVQNLLFDDFLTSLFIICGHSVNLTEHYKNGKLTVTASIDNRKWYVLNFDQVTEDCNRKHLAALYILTFEFKEFFGKITKFA